MKKLCTLFLVVLMALGLSSWCLAEVIPTPEEELYAHMAIDMGDFDQNSKVDANDALQVLKFAVGKTNEIFQGNNLTVDLFPFEADANGDGRLDANDALCILQTAVNKGDIDTNLVPWGEFSSSAYSLEDTTGFLPMVIHDSTQLTKSSLPKNLVSDYKDFPFEQKSLIVFSDLMVVNGFPTVTQVAVNGGNVLVRYRYTEGAVAGQYVVAVTVPKEYVDGVTKIFVDSLDRTGNVQPTAFSFEMDAQNTADFEEITVMMTNETQVGDFLSLMKANQWVHPLCERFLRARTNEGYFENNVLVLTYEQGIHGGRLYSHAVKEIVVEQTTATVALKTVPSTDEELVPDARRSLLVRMVDLPKDQVEHCEQFVFQYAQ